MSKPEWLRERGRLRSYRYCVNCRFLGDPCGYTNNVGDGRKVMYSCPKSSVRIYDKTLACELYERRDDIIPS